MLILLGKGDYEWKYAELGEMKAQLMEDEMDVENIATIDGRKSFYYFLIPIPYSLSFH